ncbi:F-box/kelch-repeat protein [Cardamine amara subsp. amara]|uniref:F-box/kelch-repeat protein n=1 Tax=Cardamine amara subsp. amara TaxID=228776 RepID=A0ABD1C5Z5_CARAN
MAESARENKIASMMPEWSQLNEELLQLISKHLESCFDVVHARSVCSSWRSSFPFPSGLLRPSFSLPAFADFPQESKDLCTFEKVPLFLFRVRPPPVAAVLPSEFFLGGISREKSDDHIELLPSPLQCSVKVKIARCVPQLVNMLDCQILPLGHQYRMISWDPQDWRRDYEGMAFLPLKEEGGGEFIVLLNYTKFLFVLTSAEMRWMRLKQISDDSCKGVVTFRGRFYAVFVNGDVFVIDPYSLEATLVMSSHPWASSTYLVSSGNDELFMVEKIIRNEVYYIRSDCRLRVSRLDEEAGKWVEVSDLGDRVLFVGLLGNVSCSAKELPDNCGVSGNSILFSNEPYFYKYGPITGSVEDDPNCWTFSRENVVRFLSTFSVVALQLVCQA